MMKIGLYFGSSGISRVNLSKPNLGNPGIGGTEFLVLSLAWYLNLSDEYDVIIFTQNTQNLPANLKSRSVNDLKGALAISQTEGLELFILPYFNESYEQVIRQSKIRIILWYHLAIKKLALMDSINRCKNIVRLVVVSSEVANYFRDHELFDKTIVINNFLVKPSLQVIARNYNYEKYCCFVGRMDDSNGLHILANCWSKVLKQNPDINLVVIGGNTLYNKTNTTGLLGFSDATYESKIIALFNQAGCRLGDNIFFTGTLGLERYEIMQNALVGIVNPSGKESFSLTALEFSSFGVPLVAGKDWGLFDSVIDKNTGYLVSGEGELASKINALLNLNNMKREKFTRANLIHVQSFLPERIINRWQLELMAVVEDNSISKFSLKKNYFHRKNWLKEMLRILKFQKVIKLPYVLDKSYYRLIKECVKLNINR